MFEKFAKLSLAILVTTGTLALMSDDPLMLVAGVITIVCLSVVVNWFTR